MELIRLIVASFFLLDLESSLAAHHDVSFQRG